MEEALRLKLLAANLPGVTSIAWDESPQAATNPRVVLSIVSRGREYTHDGHDGLDETRVQIDIYSDTTTQKWAIARAIIPALEAESNFGGWSLNPAFLDGDRDFAPIDMGGGRKVHRRVQDWIIYNGPVA
jgi:hypothetical protein